MWAHFLDLFPVGVLKTKPVGLNLLMNSSVVNNYLEVEKMSIYSYTIGLKMDIKSCTMCIIESCMCFAIDLSHGLVFRITKPDYRKLMTFFEVFPPRAFSLLSQTKIYLFYCIASSLRNTDTYILYITTCIAA